MSMLGDLFVPDVSIFEKIIRPILVYFFLLIALRLGGKRELGQLNGFDLIVLLILAESLQDAIIGRDNSVLGGFIGAATILITNYVVVRFNYRHPSLQLLVEGKPTLLILDGQIISENLHRELISEEELKTALRRQGFDNLAEIKTAILETSGSITIQRSSSLLSPFENELLRRLECIEQKLEVED